MQVSYPEEDIDNFVIYNLTNRQKLLRPAMRNFHHFCSLQIMRLQTNLFFCKFMFFLFFVLAKLIIRNSFSHSNIFLYFYTFIKKNMQITICKHNLVRLPKFPKCKTNFDFSIFFPALRLQPQ